MPIFAGVSARAVWLYYLSQSSTEVAVFTLDLLSWVGSYKAHTKDIVVLYATWEKLGMVLMACGIRIGLHRTQWGSPRRDHVFSATGLTPGNAAIAYLWLPICTIESDLRMTGLIWELRSPLGFSFTQWAETRPRL